MFRRLFSVVLVALATIPLWGANENTLTAESLVLPIGTTEAKLTVSLTNEAAISDIQFDLYLPTGFSVAYDEDDEPRIEVNTTRTTAKRHSVDYLEKTGFTRIMCTSSKGYTFSGNSGPVVDIYLTIDASVAAGTYKVDIKNIAVSNSENTYTPTNTTSTITIKGGGGSSTDNNSFAAANLSFDPGMTEGVLSVDLNNEVAISDIQFDLYLPTGFSVAYDEDDEPRIEVNTTRTTAKRHSVDYLEKTGFTRIMCTSSKGYTFSGNSGPVVDIYIIKDANVSSGTYNVFLKNIAISNSENTYTPADATSQITVSSVTYHNIIYKVDGEIYETETYADGASITPIAAPTKEGYTFSGWDSVPSTMPEYDVEVNGNFTINQYSVTFKVDGEVYKTFTQDYGTAITIPETPTKEGYTFSGWSTIPATMPAYHVTITGSFSPILASGITLNKSSLSFTEIDAYQTLTATVLPSNAANKSVTWTSSNTSVAAVDSRGVVTSNGYGTATITATTADGTNLSATCDVEVIKEGLYPAETISEGYYTIVSAGKGPGYYTGINPGNCYDDENKFALYNEDGLVRWKAFDETDNSFIYHITSDGNGGWYIRNIEDDSFINRAKSDNGSSTGSSDYYYSEVTTSATKETPQLIEATNQIGKWTIRYKDNRYIYSLKAGHNGATEDTSGNINIWGTSEEAQKYRMNVWYLYKITEVAVDVSSIILDMTTLSLSSVGQTAQLTATVLPTNATIKSLTWTSSDTNVATVDNNGLVTAVGEGFASITATTKDGTNISVKCNINVVVPRYTLKFVADGTVVSEESLEYGSAITAPNAPTKIGYTFVSWGDVAATMPASDVTYTAEYSINQYTLKFMADGKTVSETSIDFGSAITVPEAPAKTGYTFVSWGDVAATMPANDVTYTAQYSINQYTITFKVDGEVFKTSTQDYGSTISIPAAPTKEGYSFSGWQNVASAVPAQDVTYEANFTVNNYTLKFVADGTVVSEKSVDYGSAITAPNAPTKEGYTFVSWGNVAATMPANDVTYTAQYSINQYTVTFKVDGEVFKTLTQYYGSTISIPAAPTKEGYSFSGWQNVAKTVPASDVTYEATFTVNQYTLKFVADDKTVSETSIDFGSTITAPQAPAKEGYTFVSWGNVASTMPAKDVTYTAEYKVNQYKLTYLIDGRVYKTYMIDFGSEITPEDEAEDDDYYYGWEDVPETMPAHDVEVNAYITKVLGWAKSIDKNTTIYTLDGQKVLTPQKGNIYIINGKKVRY